METNRKNASMCKCLWFVLCVVLSGCATVPISGRRQLTLVSQTQLLQASQEQYQHIKQTQTIVTNTSDSAMVNEVGHNIARISEELLQQYDKGERVEDYNWEFILIKDDNVVNAFAMPGGKVGIYTGLLDIAQDATGLAVVMAHEVGHTIARHGSERMSHLMVVNLGGLALAKTLEDETAKTQELISSAYGIGSQVGVVLPYSRQHEKEADRMGLIIMAKAGYDPRKAVAFWTRMQTQGSARPPQYLSTHPDPDQRIENIKKYLPEALKFYNQ